MATNVIYTITSVPLALHYLDRKEFGLWLLAAQLAAYLALIDLGMSGVSRILIDYKDSKEDGRYGSAVKTTICVSVIQAFIIIAVGFLLSLYVGPLFAIPLELESSFTRLTFAHALLLAASFVTRIFSYALIAHQRFDVGNYIQIVGFAVNLSVLWMAFRAGAGLYSMIWAQAAAWIILSLVSFFVCWRWGMISVRAASSVVTWASFKEIFRFGQDIFLVMVGYQMVNASQTIIITRLLGLEALALWSVCTRFFIFMNQFVFRIFDFSSSALAEMFVRGEFGRLRDRFRELVIVSCSLAILLGAALVVCNQPFVALWTKGRFSWPRTYDCMLAMLFLVLVLSRNHIGLIGQTKLFGLARYIYIVEGVFFILLSWIAVPRAGLLGMLSATLLSSVLVSASYGAWRTSDQLCLPAREVFLGWLKQPMKLAARMIPLAIMLLLALRSFSSTIQLIVGGTVISLAGGYWFVRIGIPDGVKRDMAKNLPARLMRLAASTTN